MVDEITYVNKVVIRLCIQFVNHDIREDFLQYDKLTTVIDQVIVTTVLDGHDQI